MNLASRHPHYLTGNLHAPSSNSQPSSLPLYPIAAHRELWILFKQATYKALKFVLIGRFWEPIIYKPLRLPCCKKNVFSEDYPAIYWTLIPRSGTKEYNHAG